MCCVEARKGILSFGEEADWKLPENFETFAEVIGFMGCNSDWHVSRKLARMDPPVHDFIPVESRQMLVSLATQEYDWLSSHPRPYEAVEVLQWLFQDLDIKHFEVVGADTALYTKPWRRVTDKERTIVMGRPADPGENNGTAAVHKAMKKDRYDILSTPLFILGPELPNVSSTAARKALKAGDTETLCKLLHPAVQDWNLKLGPYACRATPQHD